MELPKFESEILLSTNRKIFINENDNKSTKLNNKTNDPILSRQKT